MAEFPSWPDEVRESVGEVFAYASVLTGGDAGAAEPLVSAAYRALWRARGRGAQVPAGAGPLRDAVRRRWIRQLADLAPAQRPAEDAARTFANLPAHVRTIAVMRVVDGLSADRVAQETGVSEADVERLVGRARRWLGATGDADDREWLRGAVGRPLRPSTEFVAALISLGQAPPVAQAEESAAVDAGFVVHPLDVAAPADDVGAEPTVVHGAVAHGYDDGDPFGGVEVVRDRRLAVSRLIDDRRWWAIAAAVVLVMATVVVVATRGSDDSGQVASSTSTGSASTSSAVSTSSGAPTSAASTLPGSTVPGAVTLDAFDPTCVERVDSTPLPTINESKADVFGPLTAKATLTIPLPELSAPANGYTDTLASVTRVPGGVVLSIFAPDGGLDATMVTLVGVDGKVRWTRCLADGGWATTTADGLVLIRGASARRLSITDGSIGDPVSDLIADGADDDGVLAEFLPDNPSSEETSLEVTDPLTGTHWTDATLRYWKAYDTSPYDLVEVTGDEGSDLVLVSGCSEVTAATTGDTLPGGCTPPAPRARGWSGRTDARTARRCGTPAAPPRC